MSELTINDYKFILKYYNKSIPKSSRLLKMAAEKILAEKLCRCIKKVDPINEARAIGICTKSILNRKGFTRGKFNFKGKAKIKFKKTNSLTKKNYKNKKL